LTDTDFLTTGFLCPYLLFTEMMLKETLPRGEKKNILDIRNLDETYVQHS